MKKIILFISLLLVGTTTYYAQIGVQTANPQSTFHIDGAKNNPSTGSPTIAQQKDDVIVNNLGMVGIGTTTPTTKLEINSDQSPAFKLVDGTQGVGKILASDGNGNGVWITSSATKPTLSGILPANTPSLSSSTWLYLNASITLPPGDWLVQCGTTLAKSVVSGNASWVQFVLTDSNTSELPSTDIDTSRSGDYISGITNATNEGNYSFASGVLAIRNNTSGNKTYYLWGHRASGTSIIVSPFSSALRERYFYAIPVNQ